jgi:hypothetical protein
MDSNLQDPCNLTATNSYTKIYSERVRLALTVLSALTESELDHLRSAVESRSKVIFNMPGYSPFDTTMVKTGPLTTQCPYCGRG